MHLVVNGLEHEIRADGLTSLLRVLREELFITVAEGRLRAGRLRCLHRADRRPAAPLLPDADRRRSRAPR